MFTSLCTMYAKSNLCIYMRVALYLIGVVHVHLPLHYGTSNLCIYILVALYLIPRVHALHVLLIGMLPITVLWMQFMMKLQTLLFGVTIYATMVKWLFGSLHLCAVAMIFLPFPFHFFFPPSLEEPYWSVGFELLGCPFFLSILRYCACT